MKKKKNFPRTLALILVAAAVVQMVSVAFAKPGEKQ